MKTVDNSNNFPEYPQAFLLSQFFLFNDILLKIDIVVRVWTEVMW